MLLRCLHLLGLHVLCEFSVGVVGGESGRDGGGAPTLRGRLLEEELDIGASGGRLQGLLVVVAEVVEL